MGEISLREAYGMTQPPTRPASRQLPPLVSFTEMVRTAVGAAAHRVAEGSRLNALAAITSHEADARAAEETLRELRPRELTRRRSA